MRRRFSLVLFYLVLGGTLYVFEYYILKELFDLWTDACMVVFISFIVFLMITFKKQKMTTQDKEFWTILARERNKVQ